ncbi:MAG TPA: CBS domain-containing protein [Steroidobacteraceae bacterium]|nr:CBS domain-containing protein [Steroidobacteraceae bacterium]
MRASQVMTSNVVTVGPDTPIEEAVRIMIGHRISGLPVVDASGGVLGLLTEGDLLRRVETGTGEPQPAWRRWLAGPGPGARSYVRTHARKVGEVMSQPPIAVAPESELAEVVALMEARRIKRVLVLERGRLIGIVSRADLLRALEQLLPKSPTAAATDAEIRRRFLSELDRQPWAPRPYLDATVTQGIVELRGLITDERERQALRVLAENTPGAKGIVDHLVWIEPATGMVIDVPPQK